MAKDTEETGAYTALIDDADYRRRVAASAERNRDPILAVLKRVLPAAGTVLEIASGTGQHAAHFAPRFPGLVWQPSDPDPDMRASIAAWVAGTPAANLRPPLDLDVCVGDWPLGKAAAVIAVNLIHIAPWDVCRALTEGAGRILDSGGVLFLYGPYKVDGRHTAPSNAAFDESLRRRDPAWGVRDLDDVAAAAAASGLDLADTVPMPANNLSVVFRKG
jgi:SAM-dependent methyltransferase